MSPVFDLLWGDEASWTVLYWLSLPFVMIGVGINYLIQKARRKK